MVLQTSHPSLFNSKREISVPEIRLLVPYCGAGGACVGYYRAASQLNMKIHITGIDIKPQPNYPFDFIQGDALEILPSLINSYNVVHASPPCQFASVGTNPHRSKGYKYLNLLPATLELLRLSGKPFVVENVPPAIKNPDLRLNGFLFNLSLIRWRHFIIENVMCPQPNLFKVRNAVQEGRAVTVAGLRTSSKFKKEYCPPGLSTSEIFEQWKYAMDIGHMKFRREIKESIPPAFTNYIGLHIFPQIAENC